MDNQVINVNSNLKHDLSLTSRKELVVTGVKNIDSFDSEEFLIQTVLGFLHIKGSNLTLDKMDNDNNELVIKGQIDSMSYVSGQKGKESKGNIFKKLLK
mgnify:CR=1 FL=1